VTQHDQQVEDILARLTLDEKVAQLVGLWETAGAEDGANVVPMQHEMAEAGGFEAYAAHGLGRADRVYGNEPIAPADGARKVVALQRWLRDHGPGLRALVQEETLVGLMTYGATAFPSPPAWGATFDPELIERMGVAIGATARRAGVQLGLAPVLDVVVDNRWGRTEECISEDPYMVGVLGAAWIRGVQSQRVIATAKHFAGHAASLGARNQAPASVGPRELADVHLLPFEMAVRLADVGAVMHSYASVDGIAPAGSHRLLTEVLRDRFGFTGFVVADFMGVTFLHTLHRVAESLTDAGRLAITAGVDMELTNGQCYPLVAEAIRRGELDDRLLDEPVRRVLRAKATVGLLDDDDASVLPDPDTLDLDPAEHRALAARVAEASVVLLENDGVLPLAAHGGTLAVVGPIADLPRALLGDYAFANHVEERFDVPAGVEVPTVLQRLREELAGWTVTHAPAGSWRGSSDAELDQAVATAAAADVVVAVVGDKAGLFGRGTVGEGCDVRTLDLPHRQRELLDRLLATGRPVVVVVVSGRAYALDAARGRAAAIVQAFLPGEEGATAIAGVLSGRVNPSGRLPLSMPLDPHASPYTYRQSAYGTTQSISEVPSAALWPFGHGLSYTSFGYEDARASAETMAVDGRVEIAATITNTGERAGAEVVQLYVQDCYAQVVRPQTELVGFAKLVLDPGESARVVFDVSADRLSFTGADLDRVVEPGDVMFRIGRSAQDTVAELPVRVTGHTRVVGSDRELLTAVRMGRPD